MNYQDYLTSISRTPITLAVITLDYCGRTFSVSPCLATGTPCYNTFPTCKYKTAYLKITKDYKFTSADAPLLSERVIRYFERDIGNLLLEDGDFLLLEDGDKIIITEAIPFYTYLPFAGHERPYIKSVTYLPTEIKDNLTINARVNIEMYDEPDTDVGIDPYLSQRSSVQGTFWKKLLKRNRNYKSREVKIYEGFLGLAEADFQQKWVGIIENVEINKDTVKIETKDLLKKLADIEVPPKLDIKNLNDIDAAATEITLTTITGLDSPSGYIRIGDEIIYYTGVNQTTNQITGCTRGYFSTVAATHKANDKIQKVRYYAPANPFNILKEMLSTDAGISSSYIDTVAFDYWRDWPGGEVNFSVIISEPTKLDKLYFEIINLIDCKSWVAEDLKITIRRNIQNEPDRSYFTLTDEANIIHDSASVDLNEKSRITRVIMYWDKTTLGKVDEVKEHNRIDVAIDVDAESANEYNEVIEKKIFCRWLRAGYMQEELMSQFIKNTITRQLFRQRNAQPLITFDAEIKDSDIKTGSYCRVSTDEILNIDGSAITNEIFQTVKRDFKGAKIHMRLLKLPSERFCFIAPNDTPDYDGAADAQREYGFITDNEGLINNAPGYYIW